jgi:GT2 family glycosyltransferase
MAVPNPKFAVKSGLALIIPTRNRPDFLRRLLANLEEVSLKPDVIVIVDSSDAGKYSELKSEFINIHQIRTEYKSAAIQRNIGLDYLNNYKKAEDIGFISFLDDDVMVPNDYFDLALRGLTQTKNCVGLSGIAKTLEDTRPKIRRNRLTDWIGITGNPGVLTSAAINISPFGLTAKSEVDWLIGCSTWKAISFQDLRFEPDFYGQSIFEDVIISVRARKLGKLICDPSIVLQHDLASEGRPITKVHYLNWVKNRFRIFSYDVPNLSKYKFWLLTLLLIANSALLAPFSIRNRDKFVGLALGAKQLVVQRLHQ